jgi:NTP pyrophosphatase (non-canonical NTP hydrolase)
MTTMWKMQERIAAFDAARFQTLGPGYLALSLIGEAGEVADIVKKLWRTEPRMGEPDGFEALPPEARERLADELADVLILTVVIANHLGIDVEAEAERKMRTIEERLEAGYYGHEAKAPSGG